MFSKRKHCMQYRVNVDISYKKRLSCSMCGCAFHSSKNVSFRSGKLHFVADCTILEIFSSLSLRKKEICGEKHIFEISSHEFSVLHAWFCSLNFQNVRLAICMSGVKLPSKFQSLLFKFPDFLVEQKAPKVTWRERTVLREKGILIL